MFCYVIIGLGEELSELLFLLYDWHPLTLYMVHGEVVNMSELVKIINDLSLAKQRPRTVLSIILWW